MALWPSEYELTFWPIGLGKYFICKRGAAQTVLPSTEFVIQLNLKHDTITIWNLDWSWNISIYRFGKMFPDKKATLRMTFQQLGFIYGTLDMKVNSNLTLHMLFSDINA